MAGKYDNFFNGSPDNGTGPASASASPSGRYAGFFSSPKPTATPAPLPSDVTPAPVKDFVTAKPVPFGDNFEPRGQIKSYGVEQGGKSVFEGGGYGAQFKADPYSGRPLLQYTPIGSPAKPIPLNDRVATTFDPTVPQKLDPGLLQNKRMPDTVRVQVKKMLGGNTSVELDHRIALELGGANTTQNLGLEPLVPGTKNTATDPEENQLARDVVSGRISYLQAQETLARSKGYKLPDESFAERPSTVRNANAVPLAVSVAPDTMKSLAELQIDPLNLHADPTKAMTDYLQSMGDQASAAAQAIADFWNPRQTVLGRVATALSGTAKLAGAALSPVTSIFKAAEDIPVIGTVAKLIAVPFAALGDAGHDAANVVGETLLAGIPEKDRTQIVQGLGDILALAGQIWAGHVAEVGVSEASDAIRTKFETNALYKESGLTPGATLVKKYGLNDPKTLADLEAKYGPKDTATIVDKAKEIAQTAPQKLRDAIATGDPQKINAAIREVSGSNYVAHAPEGTGPTKFDTLFQNAKDQLGAATADHAANPPTGEPLPPAEPLPTIDRSTVKKGDVLNKGDVISHPDIGRFVVSDKTSRVLPEGKVPSYTLKDSAGTSYQTDHPDVVGFKREVKTPGSATVLPDTNRPSAISKEVPTPVETPENSSAVSTEKAETSKPPTEETPQVKPDSSESGTPETRKVQSVGTEGAVPSKIGKSIEAKAIEAKLTQGYSKVAGYDPITIKEQSDRAADLINSNLETARQVIRGEEPLPEGLRGTALVTAMEEYLDNHPSEDMAYELANSPLVSATSAAAQEMRLAAERDPDSATAKLQEIKRAREAKVRDPAESKARAKTSLKSEMQKVNLSKEELSWDKFVENITC